MISSMTGYAEMRFVHKEFSAKISIRTLNHRFLDWNYRGTPIGAIEDKMRSLCHRRLHRGRIDVLMDVNFFGPEKWEFHINQELLNRVLSGLDIAMEAQKNITLSLGNLLNIPQVVEFRRICSRP